ncbi:MAG: hypothetical protein JXR10_08605 [Cyclobacteriaceae bacterium]
MFDGADYPKSLSEETFESWLAKGRESKIGYQFMVIVWDAFEADYVPVYVEQKSDILKYESYPESSSNESMIAAYDLYSESRVQHWE